MPTKAGHVFLPVYDNPAAKAEPGRVFYFSRHGESENNLHGKIGGNANLTSNGQKYAKLLGNFINQQKLEDIQVWHSEFVRTAQTAAHIDAPKISKPQINEISAGL